MQLASFTSNYPIFAVIFGVHNISEGPFTLNDCKSEHEIFPWIFMSLDVNNCIETNRTQFFVPSFSQSQSLNMNGP